MSTRGGLRAWYVAALETVTMVGWWNKVVSHQFLTGWNDELCLLRMPCLACGVVLVGLLGSADTEWLAEVRGGEGELADRKAVVRNWLERPLLNAAVPLAEAQEFVAARVARLPSFDSADEWERYANQLRSDVLNQVIFRGEATAWRDSPGRVEWLDSIEGGPGYCIRKLRYEALPGLWIPALLYEPERLAKQVPVVMNVNGHDADGKSAVYKQIRCINQAKRGMLALNVEWFGMGQLRTDGFQHYRMNQIDLCGTSGVAPFYLSLKRGLDVLLTHEHADPQRVAVTGLSGGGWQTIVISSLDERVTLANPVAGYTSLAIAVRNRDLGDSEQSPSDLNTVADYLHLTALRAPRPTLLTYNSKDACCFRSDRTLEPLLEAAQPVFELTGHPERLRGHVNDDPGTHNFERENREMLYRMFHDFFYEGSSDFDPLEIECDDEVKEAAELLVELPTDNADFHTLAMGLSGGLPRDAELPTTRAEAESWQHERRVALRELVRCEEMSLAAMLQEERSPEGYTVRRYFLRLNNAWTVPAVEIIPARAAGRSIMVADAGRGALAERVVEQLAAGRRILAVDPFYVGESRIQNDAPDYLYALAVANVGHRPLGLQAGQLQAIARWYATHERQEEIEPVTMLAVGPRLGLAAMVAAGLDATHVASVEWHSPLASLHQAIEENRQVGDSPELFCFGLLEQFDVLQVAALVAPRSVRFVEADERVRTSCAMLSAWYELWDATYDPFD